jgi:purine-binding chemotaxis protein CheW
MNMTPTNADDRPEGALPDGEPKQYLTFALCGEDYGIEILQVQEIKCLSRITPIPNTPPHVRGVLNLRGTVVPVVDLRAKFGLGEIEYNRFTVIIVVNVGRRVMGLVVDAVSDVLNLGKDDVQPPPELGGVLDFSFVTGMARAGDRLITLLDIERLLGQEAGTAAEPTTTAAAPATATATTTTETAALTA